MKVTASARAAEVIAEMTTRRSGTLTVTIGTGCCESTAPFLYEDFWPGPDQEAVGEVAGVVVYAPEYLRVLYPGDQGPRLEVVDELGESLSVETELGVRLSRPDCDLGALSSPANGTVLRLVGELALNYNRVRLRCSIDVETFTGEGSLEFVEALSPGQAWAPAAATAGRPS